MVVINSLVNKSKAFETIIIEFVMMTISFFYVGLGLPNNLSLSLYIYIHTHTHTHKKKGCALFCISSKVTCNL